MTTERGGNLGRGQNGGGRGDRGRCQAGAGASARVTVVGSLLIRENFRRSKKNGNISKVKKRLRISKVNKIILY